MKSGRSPRSKGTATREPFHLRAWWRWEGGPCFQPGISGPFHVFRPTWVWAVFPHAGNLVWWLFPLLARWLGSKPNFVIEKCPTPSASRYLMPLSDLNQLCLYQRGNITGPQRSNGKQIWWTRGNRPRFVRNGPVPSIWVNYAWTGWALPAQADLPRATQTQIQIWKKPPGSFTTEATDGDIIYPHFLKTVLKLGQNSTEPSDEHWASLLSSSCKEHKGLLEIKHHYDQLVQEPLMLQWERNSHCFEPILRCYQAEAAG